jgi:hypothetical protein
MIDRQKAALSFDALKRLRSKVMEKKGTKVRNGKKKKERKKERKKE